MILCTIIYTFYDLIANLSVAMIRKKTKTAL